MTKEKKMLVILPIHVVNQIRLMTAQRKTINDKTTQKEIIIEIMQNGLLVTDEAPAVMAEGELNVLPL